MKKTNRARFWVMAGMLALLVAGCAAKPPVEEQKAAHVAKDAAIAARAETYAAATVEEAKKALDKAEFQMTQKLYRKAKADYLTAKATFNQAVTEVEAGKKAMIDGNQDLLRTIDLNVKLAGKLAAKKLKKAKADVKKAWKADSKWIKAEVTKAEAKIKADAPPADIKKILEAVNTRVEKWISKFKK